MTQRRGFTLIEVLVAVAITSLVALLAHQLFTAVVDGSTKLTNGRLTLDRQRNAHRYLRNAFASLDISQGAGSFEGHPDRVTFTAWQQTADGWFERSRIDLLQESGRWLAVTSGEDKVVLADSVLSVRLDYLLQTGTASRWVGEWVSPATAPLGVRTRISFQAGGADTMVYLIKARG
jgi:prepilin-type N-terminal cleavage/methylation domain-containing protein